MKGLKTLNMSKVLKRVGIIGHFGFGKDLLNGQTIKTKTISSALEKELGSDEILKVDTHGGIKSYIKLPFQINRLLGHTKNIIMFPAHRGLKIVTPIILFLNLFHKRKLHYCVIGGWLPEMLKSKKSLSKLLKRFNYIYVETNTMKIALEKQGFVNIIVMPNFKDIKILNESELVYNIEEPFRLCTFSRVMKEKGIEDAIEAVRRVNEDRGRVVYTLDIYGQVDSNQLEWFDGLQKSFPTYVKYRGSVDFDKSVEVIKAYFALLFPTRFFTEGVPGTIIDAYAAGVPIISSMWESFLDIVEENVTGIGYSFNNISTFTNTLLKISMNSQIMNNMKLACIKKAKDFVADSTINIIISRLSY